MRYLIIMHRFEKKFASNVNPEPTLINVVASNLSHRAATQELKFGPFSPLAE